MKQPRICVSCITQSLKANQWFYEVFIQRGSRWHLEKRGLSDPEQVRCTLLIYWGFCCPRKLFPTHPPKAAALFLSPSFIMMHLLLCAQTNQEGEKKCLQASIAQPSEHVPAHSQSASPASSLSIHGWQVTEWQVLPFPTMCESHTSIWFFLYHNPFIDTESLWSSY